MEPRPARSVHVAMAVAGALAAASIAWLALVLLSGDAHGPLNSWDGTCGFGSGVDAGTAGRFRVARALWALAGLLAAAVVVCWARRRDNLGCLGFVLILCTALTSFIVAGVASERCVNWND